MILLFAYDANIQGTTIEGPDRVMFFSDFADTPQALLDIIQHFEFEPHPAVLGARIVKNVSEETWTKLKAVPHKDLTHVRRSRSPGDIHVD